ncbi:ATP-binding protein [Microbacterium sp. GXF7504]
MHADAPAAVPPSSAWPGRVLARIREEFAAPARTHAERSRGRAAVLNQLLLCAIVLVVAAFALATGEQERRAPFLFGTLLILAGGAAALLVPWARIARGWVVLVPLVDIGAIALLRWAEPDGGLGLLWTFPAMWLAGLGAVGFTLQFVLITAVYWLLIASAPSPHWGYTTFLLPIVILAISATSFVSTRRFVAQQRLLDRQAELLRGALGTAQRHELLMTEVLDAVDFGVVRIGADGTITVVNEAQGRLQRRIPALADDVEDDAVYRVDGVTPVAPEERPLRRARRGEVFDNLILWYGPPDGDRRALSLTARTLRDDLGQPAGSVLVARDVTAEMTALKARDRLVASVSHELRTPLTSVLGYIDLAEENLDRRPDEARRNLEVAAKNGERLLEIVADILAASSSSRLSVDMTISPEAVDVAALVRSAAEAARALAEEHAVTLSTEGVEPAAAFADPLRMRQVVDNLISNAVKYNREGGEVVLGTTTDGTTTWILVRDTGIGISERDQERLFERFFRARTGVDGTGLGLSISRDIVRAHHGDLTFQSAEGVGSTFMVRIPATAAAAEAS